MADKKKLGNMLDSLIADKNADAEIEFHKFAQEKLKELIHGDEKTNTNGSEE